MRLEINKITDDDLITSISSMISTLNDKDEIVLNDTIVQQLHNRSQAISQGEYISHQDMNNKFGH